MFDKGFSYKRFFRDFIKEPRTSDGRVVPVVKFTYPECTREEDKVSKKLLAAHYSIAELFHSSGGAARIRVEFGDEEDDLQVPGTAPTAGNEQERWSNALTQRLRRLSVLV